MCVWRVQFVFYMDVGVAEADMDTDYVADVTVAQGTWDLWPTPTQD